MIEEWKDIPKYEGLYQVSNLGRIKALPKEWNQKHYSGVSSHYFMKERIMKLREDKRNHAGGYKWEYIE